ncbi:hypothetical protein AAON49_03645 [Pseudotenacibaculum sp. MALMAid0570]|uniref:hypothetical protein n=1 Tax=Pseudotenacibaculum sp. MALMAid0570 TaxID=3143938 RepID=UPI0032E0542D
MKLKFITLSFVFLFTSTFLQESKTDLLCGKKWFAKYIEMGENKMPVPPGEQNQMWMIFEKDGVHKVNTNNTVKKGTWKFTKNKDSIFFTTEKGLEKKMKLETLNKESLVLVLEERGQEGKIYLEKEE